MKDRKKQRLSQYDYSTPGAYFINVCVENMRCRFGEVRDGSMNLNETGKIVNNQWNWMFEQYPYIHRDEFVIMPNHVHGILQIAGNGRDRSLQEQKIKTISELIGAFKTTSSKMIHLAGQPDFKWQKSFYDHIIRDEKELHSVREYIVNNPMSWDLDKNNPDVNGNELFARKGLTARMGGHSRNVGNGRDRSYG
jgi:REP element-mobilizing transposase RayT